MPKITEIPSAQPVVKTKERPTFPAFGDRGGGLVPPVKAPGPAFEPSRQEQGPPRRP